MTSLFLFIRKSIFENQQCHPPPPLPTTHVNYDDLTFHPKKLTFSFSFSENFPVTLKTLDILIRLLICCFILFKENHHFIKFIFTPRSFKRHHVTIKNSFLSLQPKKKNCKHYEARMHGKKLVKNVINFKSRAIYMTKN